MKELTILVTGCGGDISQSIGKILKTYKYAARVLGCDIHQDHAGHFIFNECFVIERAGSPNYLASISNLIKQQGVDILIPVTEFELEFFLVTAGDPVRNVVIIRPNNAALTVGLDKYKTAKFLEKHGLPFPRTELVSEVARPFLPCIMKHRKGSGSKVLHLVEDEKTFILLSQLLKDVICQEYVDSPTDEFTCAVFRSGNGIIRTLSFRRRLSGGYSGFGVVEINNAIDELLIKLAVALDLRGCINVQLRLRNAVPVIFEINARFSSTVLFRHLLGFEDVIWSIEDQLGLPISNYVAPPVGSKFYKGFQEYIVKGES